MLVPATRSQKGLTIWANQKRADPNKTQACAMQENPQDRTIQKKKKKIMSKGYINVGLKSLRCLAALDHLESSEKMLQPVSFISEINFASFSCIEPLFPRRNQKGPYMQLWGAYYWHVLLDHLHPSLLPLWDHKSCKIDVHYETIMNMVSSHAIN